MSIWNPEEDQIGAELPPANPFANLNPIVAQHMKNKMSVADAQKESDNIQMMGIGAQAFDSLANSQRQPLALQNRMQELGKAPSMVEQAQQKTDLSGLQQQAAHKLQNARSDESDAVRAAFEQKKAEMMATLAAKKAKEEQRRFDLNYAQKDRDIASQAKSRQAYADSMMGLKRDGLDLQREKLSAEKAKETQPKPLSAEAALKLANFQNALQAVDEMEKSLANGDNTVTLYGDNDYTLAQDKFAEGYGRGSSGASITNDERTSFKNRTPGWKNSKDEKAAKIRELREDIQMKINALKTGGLAAPATSKITVSNGTETLEIDASDLAHAEQDGYKRIK